MKFKLTKMFSRKLIGNVRLPLSRLVVWPVDPCSRVVYDEVLFQCDVLPLQFRNTFSILLHCLKYPKQNYWRQISEGDFQHDQGYSKSNFLCTFSGD